MGGRDEGKGGDLSFFDALSVVCVFVLCVGGWVDWVGGVGGVGFPKTRGCACMMNPLHRLARGATTLFQPPTTARPSSTHAHHHHAQYRVESRLVVVVVHMVVVTAVDGGLGCLLAWRASTRKPKVRK